MNEFGHLEDDDYSHIYMHTYLIYRSIYFDGVIIELQQHPSIKFYIQIKENGICHFTRRLR